MEKVHVVEDGVEVLTVASDICGTGEQDEAFYILDLGDVVRKHEEWTTRMPRVSPFFAVKCHNDLAVIRTLASLGAGFDCASKAELDQVVGDVGVAASRVIFANPAKAASHIRHAATLGVHLMVFDNDIELRKMLELDPDVRLVLRFRCDARGSVATGGDKFGCDAVLEAPLLIRLAVELGGHLEGVSFHAGYNIADPEVFHRGVELARGLFDVAEEMGVKMTLVNLGGGFPGFTGSSIAQTASVINASLAACFPSSDVTVIAEPGTYYVASAFTLYTQISAKREILEEGERHVMYYINQGVFASFTRLLFHLPFPPPTPMRATQGAVSRCSVWGPTCAGVDVVERRLRMPELHAGDWLEFKDVGAYTRVVGSAFNGFAVARVHVVADNATWMKLRDQPPMSRDDFVCDVTPSVLRLGLK